MTLKTTSEVKIDLKDVQSVYVGKPNHCMCGCAGTYTYTEINRKKASKERGYEVTDKDVNDKKVQRILNKIEKDKSVAENIDNYIFTKIIGKTQYTIYLNCN